MKVWVLYRCEQSGEGVSNDIVLGVYSTSLKADEAWMRWQTAHPNEENDLVILCNVEVDRIDKFNNI